MEVVVISLVALVASLLTFFSGFGLGTILMPVFALFFPLEAAIAMTGIAHFANNIFKIILVGRSADKSTLIRFGLPAFVASFAGAWLLMQLSDTPTIFSYSIAEKSFEVTVIKVVIGGVLIFFSLMEILPRLKNIQFGQDKLIVGGILSGFFGGLSGIQGALRSAFLIRSGLNKEAYIATGVVIAMLVDFSRLTVYFSRLSEIDMSENIVVMLSATISAIIGAYFGKKLLKKVTYEKLQLLVAIMLIIISIALIGGLI